ncbi:CAMK family protein kinase [Tritrichomonas foetus]|uniref:non-specific serine/threonine protein kinase n=1 Tax=Tritrichomonas foetus TaxID=1144522 RepID=A0A1J4KB48_9EUKA|nr:CAMK family protein kinase [Tritrichomonas foetus]|eukprot:OHT06693.1 CAMK family protein kinase [Tritrichomonas foetus]
MADEDDKIPFPRFVGLDKFNQHANYNSEMSPGKLYLEKNYILGEKIGEGSFGCVYKAVHRLTNSEVSIKMIDKFNINSSPDARKHFDNEKTIFKTLNHPLITQYYEMIDCGNEYCIVSELASYGNLLKYVNEHPSNMNEKEARRIFTQIVHVVKYLHFDKKMAHRDLKLDNVLLDKDKNIKLIDFGFAKLFEENKLFSSICGSIAYVAPEVITGKPYNEEADVWSLGVMLYAMVNGQLPFNGDSPKVQLQRIASTEPYYPSRMSNSLVDLLRSIFTKDYKKRITLDDILKHPWITAEVSDIDGIISIYNQEVSVIDESVIKQLHYRGIDTQGIEDDIFSLAENERTVAYRLIQRAKINQKIRGTLFKKSIVSHSKTIPASLVLRTQEQCKRMSENRCTFTNLNRETDSTSENNQTTSNTTISARCKNISRNQNVILSSNLGKAAKQRMYSHVNILNPKDTGKKTHLQPVNVKPKILRF